MKSAPGYCLGADQSLKRYNVMDINHLNTALAEQFVFWDAKGNIRPHLLYDYFNLIGIGNYFSDEKNMKTADPTLVKTNGNVVSKINVGHLLEITKEHILRRTEETGDSGPILDSLHAKTALFSDKNLRLLKTLPLNFISDTPEYGYFFFLNGVVQISATETLLKPYSEFDDFVWESSIIQRDYVPVETKDLQEQSDQMRFLSDLTVVVDPTKTVERTKSLASAIGYMLHRFKDPTTTKAIILMDVYVDGQPNGGSGKTLLIQSIGKVRNLSIVDGKKYDQREWFALSSVDLGSELLLFDDTEKNFNFEEIFPLVTTGFLVRLKYKNNVYLPFEKSPKVAITTNYAILGDSSSHKRRKFEFEISPTYSAKYSPREKFGRTFFEGWDDEQWNLFYNTMFQCLQVFLKEGLVESEPINLNLTKLINKTCEEFVEWIDERLDPGKPYDKKALYNIFLKAYPELAGKLKQRDFTFYLRSWGEYSKQVVTETHSGDTRYIQFTAETIV